MVKHKEQKGKNMKKGFTLSEMLVTLAVISFLIMILFPVLKKSLPNQEQAMFKKAYYITERVVSELINDDDLYAELREFDTGNPYFGNTVEVEHNGTDYEGNTKFCELFASKINRSSVVTCDSKAAENFTNGVLPTGTLVTADSIVWKLPITDFDSATDAYDIFLDVNGNKGPNCIYDKDTCKKPDRFNIKVYQDGRVSVEGTMEIEYLNRVEISKDAKSITEQAKKDEEEDK